MRLAPHMSGIVTFWGKLEVVGFRGFHAWEEGLSSHAV